MSFAEFQIRLFAYRRMQTREWEKTRLIAYSAFIGSHQDPKKLPKTIDSFMKLDSDNGSKKEVSKEMKERFLNAYKEYLNKVQHG